MFNKYIYFLLCYIFDSARLIGHLHNLLYEVWTPFDRSTPGVLMWICHMPIYRTGSPGFEPILQGCTHKKKLDIGSLCVIHPNEDSFP